MNDYIFKKAYKKQNFLHFFFIKQANSSLFRKRAKTKPGSVSQNIIQKDTNGPILAR